MSGEHSVLTWLPALGGLALKSLLVFLVAGAALLALRRASASARHLVCLLTLGGLLALPLLSLGLPGWRLAVLAPAQRGEEPAPRQVAAPPETGGGRVLEAIGRTEGAAGSAPAPAALHPSVLNSSASRFGRTPASEANKEVGSPWPLLVALWLVGVLIAALRPLLGLWGIARLSQTSAAVLEAPTLALTAECASALGLSRVPALRQADAPVPMTWGWRRPVVLLPVGAQNWPEGRLRAVLLHELAHVRRHDWLSHRLADCVCALYWFHPLAWLTARRLRAEGEIACDDLVLTSGVAAPDYARHLLDVARALRPALAAVPQTAIAMARTARIEGRLTMILDTTRPRRALTRRALLTVLSLSAAALIPLAVLRPGVRAQAAPALVAIPHVAPIAPPTLSVTGLKVNGTSLLAGLTDADKPGASWWSVSGALLPTPVYDTNAHHAENHTRSNTNNVIFALRLPPAARGITVQYDLPQSLTFSSDGSWVTKMRDNARQTEGQLFTKTNGARVVTAAFPASLQKASIRVGLASGPWTIDSVNGNPREGGSVATTSGTFIFSPAIETKNGTTLTLATNELKRDVRVVALNAQGHELLPTSIGDQSNGLLDQITAHFNLSPSQIREFRVETRPFHSVEFKNVALRPAK